MNHELTYFPIHFFFTLANYRCLRLIGFSCNAITYSRNISGVQGFPSLTVRYMPLRSRYFHLLKVSFFWQLNNLLVVILISLVSLKCMYKSQ